MSKRGTPPDAPDYPPRRGKVSHSVSYMFTQDEDSDGEEDQDEQQPPQVPGYVAHNYAEQAAEPEFVFNLEECRGRCAKTIQGRTTFIHHVDGDGRLMPCPTMFEKREDIIFVDHRFQPTDPCQLASDVHSFYLQHEAVYSQLFEQIQFVFQDNDRKAKLNRMNAIAEVYTLMAIHHLMVEANGRLWNAAGDLHGSDGTGVLHFLDMLHYNHAAFQNTSIQTRENEDTEKLRQMLWYIHANYIRFDRSYLDLVDSITQGLQTVLNLGRDNLYFSTDVSCELSKQLTLFKNANGIALVAHQEAIRPNASLYNRLDESNTCHIAMRMMLMTLVVQKAIIVDATREDHVMVSLPIKNVKNPSVPTYLYSPGMTLMAALRAMKADQILVENYVLHRGFVNGVLCGSNEQSLVPRVKQDFSDDMRYIAALNGVFCCRTCIMYYHRHAAPEQLPDTYTHFSDQLKTINGGYIRTMQYIPVDIDYYQIMSDLLAAQFLRMKDEGLRNHYEECAGIRVRVNTGSDARLPDDEDLSEEHAALRDEQTAYIKERWETFDQWIHDADFLAELNVLDVRMRSMQKIMYDQRIPRNAYAEVLASLGRALCGVIGDKTRGSSGAHKLLEEVLGKSISDRMEYATVFQGLAGTGKSTFLKFLEKYFVEDLRGYIADNRRPIDPYVTIRNKAVVISSDMQKEEQVPVAQGDLKKMVSTEPVTHHRLHTDSIILVTIAHIIFAMNDPLPYPDAKGDMLRRFQQIRFHYRITAQMASLSDGDDRALEDIFMEEDYGTYPVICCLTHKRKLLNVGHQPYYRANKSGFQVPKYILATQAEYGRAQNSFRAFILSF